jgi:hypothetical protein
VNRASPSIIAIKVLIQLSGRLATSLTPHPASSSQMRRAMSARRPVEGSCMGSDPD